MIDLRQKKLFLLDMDGTIYLGDTLFDGTLDFLSRVRERGGKYLFVTNNSSRSVSAYVDRLAGMGIASTADEFLTSVDACILLGRGVDFVATNPDWVCPTSYGSVPDCGSVCEMLFRATGRRPKFIGKPEPEMALLSMERWGFSPEETVLIGDRIYTDIACGVNAGIDTAFVLSGEGVPEDIEKLGIHPAGTYRDIREILEHMA